MYYVTSRRCLGIDCIFDSYVGDKVPDATTRGAADGRVLFRLCRGAGYRLHIGASLTTCTARLARVARRQAGLCGPALAWLAWWVGRLCRCRRVWLGWWFPGCWSPVFLIRGGRAVLSSCLSLRRGPEFDVIQVPCWVVAGPGRSGRWLGWQEWRDNAAGTGQRRCGCAGGAWKRDKGEVPHVLFHWCFLMAPWDRTVLGFLVISVFFCETRGHPASWVWRGGRWRFQPPS